MSTAAIYRSVTPEFEIRAAVANPAHAGRVVDGLAVPYNRTQRIDANLTERFMPGAFAHQVDPGAAQRVKFAREHMALGGALIGRVLELTEDPAGLRASLLVSRTAAGEETLALIADGALDELSIGFYERPRGNRTAPDGVVERHKADLFEIASVLEGAYGRGAKVTGTRSAEDDDGAPVVELDADAIRRLDRARALLAGLVPA